MAASATVSFAPRVVVSDGCAGDVGRGGLQLGGRRLAALGATMISGDLKIPNVRKGGHKSAGVVQRRDEANRRGGRRPEGGCYGALCRHRC